VTKVLFIYPPITCYGSGLVVKSHAPMGLLYLATYIRDLGYEVNLLDALAEGLNNTVHQNNTTQVGLNWPQIKKYIKKCNPDVIGISVMFTAYYDDALLLAKQIKTFSPKIKIIFGGSHVSINPADCLSHKFVDFAIYGEGEITFKKLLEAISLGKNFEKINGLVYRDKNKKKITPPADLVKNLDDLPFPDWDLLNLKKYNLGDISQMRKPCFIVETSRGCPNHCVYCSSFAVWQHHWRGRSAKNVVDEIQQLINKYGAKEISFYDDSMSADKKRMINICKEIIKRKLDIKWSTPNGIAHWTLDKPLLKLMKKAGCYRITFGIESGDPLMRRWIGKPYSLEQARDLTQYANKLGFWTLATNIIGFPYETRDQINQTLDFSLNSDVDIAFFFRLGLRPGAPVYEIFKKEGLLPKDKKILFSENLSCNTKNFTGNELVEIQQQMYRLFFKKRWGNIFKTIKRLKMKIKNPEDFFYVLKQIKYINNFEKGWVSQKSGILLKSNRV